MTKARRDKTPGREPQSKAASTRPTERAPDWLLFGLALAGAVLTGYLAMVALNETAPAFCSAGSGCDVVQHSRWSRLFGIPIALWGFGLYALIAICALFATTRVKSWRRLWSLSLLGLAISVYLTLAGAIALDAFCAWCLLSLALFATIFVIATLRRPNTAPGLPWQRWLLNHGIVLIVVIGVLHVAQAGLLVRPEDPRMKALAEQLSARGAKFYGASWCPNCQTQKDLFGRSAERLPYVECSPNGRNGAVAFACVSANVTAYPTWIIRGRPYPEVLQPEQLARRVGFDWEGFVPPASE